MPPLPNELYQQFKTNFGLSDYDAELLTEEKQTAFFFLSLVDHVANKKGAANLIINKIVPYCKEEGLEIDRFPVGFVNLASFIQLIEDGKVSSAIAYQRIFPALVVQPDLAPIKIAENLNLLQSDDQGFLHDLIDEVLAAYPDKVAAYQKGKIGLLGFFMGEVMKRSKGKAEPKATNMLIREKLK